MRNELDRSKIQSVNGVDFEYVDDETTFNPTWRTVLDPEKPRPSRTILESLLAEMSPVAKPKKINAEVRSKLVFSRTQDLHTDTLGMIEVKDVLIAIGHALKAEAGSVEFAGREYAKGKKFDVVLSIQEL